MHITIQFKEDEDSIVIKIPSERYDDLMKHFREQGIPCPHTTLTTEGITEIEICWMDILERIQDELVSFEINKAPVVE